MKLTTFDPADYLDSEEAIAAFLREAVQDENPEVFVAALAAVARARGVATVAEAAGLGRESLCKALAPGAKPRFDTIYRVLRATGMQLSINVPAKAKRVKLKPRAPLKASAVVQASRKVAKGR